MANNDASLYNIRYNEIGATLEAQNGPNWVTLDLSGQDTGMTQLTGDVTAGPGSGSQVATVAFVGGKTASEVATAVTQAGAAISSLTGDVTGTGPGATATTLATTIQGQRVFDYDNTNNVAAQSNGSIVVQSHTFPTAQLNIGMSNLGGFYGFISAAIYGFSASPLFLQPIVGNVGIGTTTDVASAQLHMTSTSKGFLPPRMNTTERDAISSPAEGLIIYNTQTHKLNVFTTGWEAITSA